MREEKKRAIIYSDIHKLANAIYSSFLNDNAKYEINLSEKTIKEIKMKLVAHNQNYKANTTTQLNDDKIDIENLYDEAYDEVLQVLFVDVYTEYITNRNQIKGKNAISTNVYTATASNGIKDTISSNPNSSNYIPSEENLHSRNSSSSSSEIANAKGNIIDEEL